MVNKQNPRFLFSMMDSLVNGARLTPETSDNFELYAKHFIDRIMNIRANIYCPPLCMEILHPQIYTEVLNQFIPISLKKLRKIVQHLKPSYGLLPATIFRRNFFFNL